MVVRNRAKAKNQQQKAKKTIPFRVHSVSDETPRSFVGFFFAVVKVVPATAKLAWGKTPSFFFLPDSRRQGNGGIARSRRYNTIRACEQVNVYPRSVTCTFAPPSPASNFTSDFVSVKTLQTLITRSEKKCGFNASVRSLSQCSMTACSVLSISRRPRGRPSRDRLRWTPTGRPSKRCSSVESESAHSYPSRGRR